MLRKFGIIAVLSLLVSALAAVPALAATFTPTFNDANAPSGTHLQTGTIECVTTGTTVDCSSYELAGVGNADAEATLTATYTATVDCQNKGGNIVEVKAQVEGATADTGQIESKNGRLLVPTLSTAGLEPDPADFEEQATCPNGNWTKITRTETIALTGFTYELTFVDKVTGEPLFPGPYITITGTV